MEESFAEVAVLNALGKTLHYRVPPELLNGVRVGVRVLVPLGPRETSGLVISLHRKPPDLTSGISFRPILEVLDASPVVTPELISMCQWISKLLLLSHRGGIADRSPVCHTGYAPDLFSPYPCGP